MLMTIPVEISGSDIEGKSFTERTHTQVIHAHAASVLLRHLILPEAEMVVKNLETGQACRFRARQPIYDVPSGLHEWEIECLEPAPRFWGLSFADPSRHTEEQTVGSLLECTGCHCRELTKLSIAEYLILVKEHSSPRQCAWCGRETSWKFAQVPLESGAERRQEERRIVHFPVWIRHEDGREEFTMTENVSRTGVCCMAHMKMAEGDHLFVRLLSDEGPGEADLRARVIWRRKINDRRGTLYGMSLERKQPNDAQDC